jgi:hypothetical protein
MTELVIIRMSLRPVRRSASAVVVALLCALASCGTGSTPSSTTPSATAEAPTSAASATACADVAALKASIEILTEVKPAEDGVVALETAIDNVKISLASAQASASEALQPSVEQVTIALGNVQFATAGLTDENRREKAPAIAAALEKVRTATAGLSSTLKQSCPGS